MTTKRVASRLRHLRGLSVPSAIGALVGFLIFLKFQKLSAVNPSNTEAWIAGDWGTHMLGWLHFRNAPLFDFPIGQIPNLGEPIGISLIFTDALPLVALILRPFSAILPTDFQYLGLWMLACFVLQGLLGARIAATRTDSRLVMAGAAALFVLMPAFLLRNVHPPLAGHWVILVVILAALGPAKSRRWSLVGFVTLCSLIHPYLWIMVVGLLSGLLLDDVRRGASRFRVAAIQIGMTLGASVAIYAAMGAFSDKFDSTVGGFGRGSADPLTFVSSYGMSRWIPSLPLGANQGEGIAYLGLGVLILLAVVVLGLGATSATKVVVSPRLSSREPKRSWWHSRRPFLLGVAAVLLMIYATSNEVISRNERVLDLRAIYSPILPLAERFRSSGRMVWPLMYVVVTIAVLGVVALVRRYTKRPGLIGGILIASCAGVQVADVTIMNRYDAVTDYFFGLGKAYRVAELDDPRWKLIGKSDYRRLQTVPATVYGCGGVTYDEGFNSGRIALLSLEAYRRGLSINAGYFSRLAVDALPTCQRQDAQAGSDLLADTVYVFLGGVIPPQKSICEPLNALRVCVNPGNQDRFAQSLRRAG